MAVRKVGARVEIDGEREYKAALSELNNGNRVLASEMRKLQAEYKGNAESTEFLTKKGELLERQLLQQKDKVSELRAALQNAAEQYGEADSRTQAWAVKLNDAEAAQYNLEHAIEENNKALEDNGRQLQSENTELVSVGDTVDDLAGKFGIRLPDGLKKSLDSMQGFSAGTALAMAGAAAAVAALAKTVGELHEMTKKAAADVDEILTESLVTGLSTKTIQELKYAENLIDVSYSTITASMTKLTQSMAAVQSGNEKTAASFAALGVAITDENGQLRDAESVFYDVIDALGKIENPTERDAAAMELLGKSAQELNPLIIQGSQALRDLSEEAERNGYVLDESQLKKLGEVDDAYQKLQLQLDATKKELSVEFAPASKAAMEAFAKLVKAAGDALVKSGLLDGLVEIVVALANIVDDVSTWTGLTPGLTDNLKPLREVLRGIATAIATIEDASNVLIGALQLGAAGPFSSNQAAAGVNRIKTGLGLNAASGQYSNLQRLEQYRAEQYGSHWDPELGAYVGNYYYTGTNASGNQNWRGGMTYLSEGGPETAILPSGTRILSAQDTRALGGDTFYITIDAKNVREFNDIVELARSARVRGRMK